VTDEQDFPSIQEVDVQASVSVNKSQISPSSLPVLVNQSRYVGQSGLASAKPSHIKHTK